MRKGLFKSLRSFILAANIVHLALFYALNLRGIRQQVREYLFSLGEPAAFALSSLLAADDLFQAQAVLANLMSNRYIDAAYLVDNQGRYLMGAKERSGESFVLLLPVFGPTFYGPNSEDLKAVLLLETRPQYFLREELDTLISVFLMNTMITVSLGLLFYLVMRTYLFRPLAAIHLATERVSNGTYARVAQKGSFEFGELFTSFNRMSANLQLSQERLQALNEHLLYEVASRTLELQRLKDRFQDIAETVGHILWEIDPQGRFTFCSPGITAVLGYSPEEVLGKPLAFSLASDKSPKIRAELERVLRERKPFDLESRHCSREGRKLFLRITGKPFFSGEGALLGFRGASRDTTAEKELQDRLQSTQRLQILGSLVGGISHDFNNIINVIQNNSKLLLREPDALSNPRLEEGVREIHVATQRASSLISRLLIFGRRSGAAKGSICPSRQLAHLQPFLSRTLGKGIEIVMELEHRPSRLDIDPTEFDQIFLNLAVNSRDAMPESGRITVRGTLEQLEPGPELPERGPAPGTYYRALFADTGCGMTQEVQKKIFEPFFTTKTAGHGSGLGLSIVFAILNNLGGSIRVAESSSRGTVFELLFPVRLERPPDSPAESEVLPFPETRRVLVVDDEEQSRKVFRRILEALNCSCLAASGCAEALSLLEREEVDLIILDLEMPEVNGERCLPGLQRIGRGTPILVASGFLSASRVEALQTQGVQHFIEKPFSIGTLREKLGEMLGSPGGK